MIDISQSQQGEKRIGGQVVVNPFIFRGSIESQKQETVWLEYSPNCPPSVEDVFKVPKIPRDQTLNDYASLERIVLNGNTWTYRAVADRIVDGEIVFFKCFNGCMWGMVPREKNGDEPAPS